MSPLVRKLNTIVKDTNHALQIFKVFQFGGNDDDDQRFLYTMDIKSLYTVIPHNDGLEALAYFLDKRPVLDPPTSTLTRLVELVLTINAFTFHGGFYHQIGRVAMGSKMGPNYACLSSCNNVPSKTKSPYSPLQNPCHNYVIFSTCHSFRLFLSVLSPTKFHPKNSYHRNTHKNNV